MKVSYLIGLIGVLMALGVAAQSASDNYQLERQVVAGGGSTTTNPNYRLSGTVAQPAADAAVSSESYRLQGGFWFSRDSSPQPPDAIFSDSFEALGNGLSKAPFAAKQTLGP